MVLKTKKGAGLFSSRMSLLENRSSAQPCWRCPNQLSLRIPRRRAEKRTPDLADWLCGWHTANSSALQGEAGLSRLFPRKRNWQTPPVRLDKSLYKFVDNIPRHGGRTLVRWKMHEFGFYNILGHKVCDGQRKLGVETPGCSPDDQPQVGYAVYPSLHRCFPYPTLLGPVTDIRPVAQPFHQPRQSPTRPGHVQPV